MFLILELVNPVVWIFKASVMLPSLSVAQTLTASSLSVVLPPSSFYDKFSVVIIIISIYCYFIGFLTVDHYSILRCRSRSWIGSFISCSKCSERNQSQNECCHGSQRYNLFRDLIQYISLPINFLRCFAARIRRWGSSCPTQGGFFWDSPPAPACTSTTASAVASGTGRIIPAWRYAVAVFPLPIT